MTTNLTTAPQTFPLTFGPRATSPTGHWINKDTASFARRTDVEGWFSPKPRSTDSCRLDIGIPHNGATPRVLQVVGMCFRVNFPGRVRGLSQVVEGSGKTARSITKFPHFRPRRGRGFRPRSRCRSTRRPTEAFAALAP